MAGLWDDATEPYTGQPQMADDGSLLSRLYRSFGSPSMFSAPDPSQGQSMFSAAPQPITQSIDPSIQPTLALRDPARQKQAMDIALSFGPGAIRAFHGSPHDFPAFDINKIGTGEGAQTYGHGLYFAESPAVAQSYRDKLSGRVPGAPTGKSPYLVNDVPIPEGQSGHMALDTATEIEGLLQNLESGRQSGVDYLSQQIENRIGRWKQYEPTGGSADRDMAALADYYFTHVKNATADQITKRPPGKMYEAALNVEPEHLLDWDKPLSEQSEHVNKALSSAGWQTERMQNHTGADIINQYNQVAPGGEFASQKLKAAGIPGIRYLDQGSRAAGQGTSNYVMFNDKNIDILRKYGVPGLITGGAVGAANEGNQ